MKISAVCLLKETIVNQKKGHSSVDIRPPKCQHRLDNRLTNNNVWVQVCYSYSTTQGPEWVEVCWSSSLEDGWREGSCSRRTDLSQDATDLQKEGWRQEQPVHSAGEWPRQPRAARRPPPPTTRPPPPAHWQPALQTLQITAPTTITLPSSPKTAQITPSPIIQKPTTVELQWLEHLWDHGKVFEPWVVRATEG